MDVNLLKYIQSAKEAGCPKDQIERFVKAGYIATPEQLRFHALARECDSGLVDDILLGGNRASTKSHCTIAQVGIDDCHRVNGLKFLYLRKTLKAAAESFEDLVRRVLAGVKCKITSDAVDFDNGSKIIIGGYDDESDIDKYIGIEYHGLVIEERNQLPWKKIEKLYGSIRTSIPSWLPRKYSSTNPGGVGHNDSKTRYVIPWRNGKETNTRYLHFDYKNNPFIDVNYKKYLESLTGVLAAIWRDGSWDVAEGQFFTEFGDHNKCKPFELPFDSDGRLFASLDHGIAHYTSFGFWYIALDGTLYRLFSYFANGGTTKGHAEAIKQCIESFNYSHGQMPDIIYFDPSMQTQHKLSESLYRSDIDEYKDTFANTKVSFLPANNRKPDGCHIMQELFTLGTGKPKCQYFENYNGSFEDGIKFVQVDENHRETYAKMDGDDAADEARYGMVAAYTRRNDIIKKTEEAKKRKEQDAEERLLAAASGGPSTWMGV